MKRLIVLLVVGLLILPAVPPTSANNPAMDEVRARFENLSRSEVEAMGYEVEPVCVDASILPQPVLDQLGLPPTAAMGYHAVRKDRFDDQLNDMEPEVVLFGPNDEILGIEYEAVAETKNPVVLGQPMNLLPDGHEGMEFAHYVLHYWFVDNPAGQFADFNPALTCPPGPLTAAAAVDASDNKAILERYAQEIWNEKNREAIGELIAADFVGHQLPADLPSGREGFTKWFDAAVSGFPDLHAQIEDLISEGDKVVARVTLTGTHDGTFMGIPGTGKQISVSGISIARIEHGQVAEFWETVDMLDWLAQVGVTLTPPEGAKG